MSYKSLKAMAARPNPKKIPETAAKEKMQLQIAVPTAVTDEPEVEKWGTRLQFPEQTMPTGKVEEIDGLLAENSQMKRNLGKCLLELRQKNEALLELKEDLQHLVELSTAQQMEYNRMNRLKDEMTVVQQRAVETQLRQLNELQPMTEETRALKQRLISMNDHLQQPSTSDEQQHGICCLASQCHLKMHCKSGLIFLLFFFSQCTCLRDGQTDRLADGQQGRRSWWCRWCSCTTNINIGGADISFCTTNNSCT